MPLWSLIQDLHPSNAKSAIKVRLVRSYDNTPRYSNKVFSHECVFHDSEGDRIHATIDRSLISKFKHMLKEDHIYGIKNFLVLPNINKYKTTSRMYYIKLISNTHLTPISYEDFFPRHYFNFKSFEDVLSIHNVNESVFFDVIGVVKESSMKNVLCSDGRMKQLIEILIEDEGHNKLKCALWEEYADEVGKALDTRNEKLNIMIIQMGRPNLHQGAIQVCNGFKVTKIWFNHDLPEINSLRARIKDDASYAMTVSTLSLSSSSNNIGDGPPSINTIEELEKGQDGTSYWISGTIIAVECRGGWSYPSCKNCPKKVKKLENNFYCDRCNRYDTSANMRFKLWIYVSDETSCAQFLLWDRECTQLIGKRAADFIAENQVEDLDVVPQQIEVTLVDRNFLFKVQKKVDKETNFIVTKVKFDSYMVEASSKNSQEHQESDSTCNQMESTTMEESVNETALESENITPINEDKSHGGGEWLDDGFVKRSLDDQFSSAVSGNKSRVFVKQEKTE